MSRPLSGSIPEHPQRLKNMNTGYIKIFRKLLDWEWIDQPEMVCLWINLLLRANHTDREWHGFTVKRGQFVTSLPNLAKIAGQTVKQVRGSLDRLKRAGQVACKSTNKYTIITICKYDNYQGCDEAEGQAEGQTKGQTKGRQRADKGQAKGNKQELKNNKETISFTNVHDIAKKGGDEKFLKFQTWILRHAPSVADMPQPFTQEEFEDIMANYSAEEVRDVLEQMDNWTKLNLRKSAYKTCCSWLKKRHSNQQNVPAPERRSKIAEALDELVKTGSDPGNTERLI